MSEAPVEDSFSTARGGQTASGPKDRPRIVVSCEHGGNEVPRRYASLFRSPGAARRLTSHRGWDVAALPLAQYLAERWSAPLHHSTVSRLLIDLNRALDSHELFSQYSLRLAAAERQALVEEFYTPYRQRVLREVESILEGGRTALHVSVHSFTPRIRGVWRAMEIGLLFDPERAGELELCQRWQQQLGQRLRPMRVRLNEPYLGISDGLTTTLRTQLPAEGYLGIEIEINQRLRRLGEPERKRMYQAFADSLLDVLGQ